MTCGKSMHRRGAFSSKQRYLPGCHHSLTGHLLDAGSALQQILFPITPLYTNAAVQQCSSAARCSCGPTGKVSSSPRLSQMSRPITLFPFRARNLRATCSNPDPDLAICTQRLAPRAPEPGARKQQEASECPLQCNQRGGGAAACGSSAVQPSAPLSSILPSWLVARNAHSCSVISSKRGSSASLARFHLSLVHPRHPFPCKTHPSISSASNSQCLETAPNRPLPCSASRNKSGRASLQPE